jgi:glyoxylase-like metal-dependent hydrolase (beta-lactamase superfamily II)
VISIGPGISAWVSPNSGGWGESNAGLISGHKASLLVDTLWDLPRTAAMLADFHSQLGSAPIAQVVNTHSDGDHCFGNQLTGASQIIATDAAARRMRRHGPGEMRALGLASRVFPALGGDWCTAADYFDDMMRPFDFSKIRSVPPTSTFSGRKQLEVGGRRVELTEVGPAHTDGDLVVYLPEERIVFAGDILFTGVAPVLWDGSAENWIRACEQILSWKVDVVVPGHGPITDLAAVESMRRYWQFLLATARTHFDRGEPSATAARRILGSDEYRQRDFATWTGQERIVINIHALYKSWKGRTSTSPIERLNVLRKAALLARDLPRP